MNKAQMPVIQKLRSLALKKDQSVTTTQKRNEDHLNRSGLDRIQGYQKQDVRKKQVKRDKPE